MSNTQATRDFFVAGGTLRSDSPSYVPRPADGELHRLAAAGKLCYVLTTRQMGKSSLMQRVSKQLRQEGAQTALIDLTSIGSATLDEWYLSLLDDLESQLDLSTPAEKWWFEHANLSPAKRLTKFLSEVVLPEVAGPVVIFIDEVDSVLHLPFSDDFFAAIRAIYNQALAAEDSGRLSFVLLGVAAPNDLIRNRLRTPFNIGERIELEELALADARTILAKGLPDAALVERIFHWTAGHPYLTQKIGQAIARSEKAAWSEAAVDELVGQLFLTERARSEESNLQFVAGRILASPQRERLLYLYGQVLVGKPIANDERSAVQSELKLYGLVRRDETGKLMVRNRIYQQVFDQSWLRQHRADHRRRNLLLLLGAAVLLLALLAGYFWQQAQRTNNELLAQSYRDGFNQSENPTLRLDYLARLLALPDYEAEAVTLFETLPAAAQAALFTNATPDLSAQTEAVVFATYTTLVAENPAEPAENTAVLSAMAAALQSAPNREHPTLPAEIESWLDGRAAAQARAYEAARLAYSVALSLNDDNPAVYYERAWVALALGDGEAALDDLTRLLDFGEAWAARARQTVLASPALHPLIEEGGGPFAGLLVAAATQPPAAATSTQAVPPTTGLTPEASDTVAAVATATRSPATLRPLLSSQGRLTYVQDGALYLETAADSGIIQAVGGDLATLSPAGWSPNGRRILLTAPDGLWVMDVTQGTLALVTEAFNIDNGWWLDDSTVLVQLHCQPPCQSFAAYNLAGELRWELTNETTAEMAAGLAALSLNRRVLVILNDQTDPHTVEIVETTTGTRTTLWQLAAGERFAPLPPHVSPDGQYVAFSVLAADQSEGPGATQLVGRDGRSYGRRDNSLLLDWQPGGGPVVSQEVENGQNQLVYWPLGGPAARIFVLPRAFTFPAGAWSPDGRTFVYSALDTAIEASYLYLWQPDGGLADLIHAVASPDPFTHFAWLPDSQGFYFSLAGQGLWYYELETAAVTSVAADE
jgi:hypothetical protein